MALFSSKQSEMLIHTEHRGSNTKISTNMLEYANTFINSDVRIN